MTIGITPDDITHLARSSAKMGWLYGYMEGSLELIRITQKEKSRKFLEKYVRDELRKESKFERSLLFQLMGISSEELEVLVKKLEK